MLNRDFTKTKRDYLNKNKAVLIALSIFILVGIIVTAILGFNANPDFTGGYAVDIKVNEEVSNKELDNYEDKINSILNENNLSLYSVQLKGQGENSILEVKYTGKLTQNKINKVNASFATKLDNVENEFEHEEFSKIVSSTDYIYAVVAGLLIVLIAALFVTFRHNIAYAMSLMGASLFSVIGLMSVFGILRLEIGMPFFFIVISCLVYTVYESIILFEKMREVSSIQENKNDKSKHIVMGMKNSSTRLQYTSLGLFFLGFLFVVFGTAQSRIIALGFMFSIVLALLSISMILPFIYNLTIEKVTFKDRKVSSKEKKETKTKNKEVKEEKTERQEIVEENKQAENAEEVVEERYTQEAIDVEVVDTKADTTNLEE